MAWFGPPPAVEQSDTKPIATPPKEDTPPVRSAEPAKHSSWVWTQADYDAWITSPQTHEEKLKFYNNIKEFGFDPQGVTGMSSKKGGEYHHWSDLARKHASEWIMDYATPAPAPFNGMRGGKE